MLGKVLGLVGAAVFVAATIVEMTERLVRKRGEPACDGDAEPEPADESAERSGGAHGERA